MTIRDYTLTRIAIFVFFSFTSTYPTRIPAGTDRYGRLEREDRIGNVAWEGSGFKRMSFSDGMGSMEVVLSEPECQYSLQWPSE